MIGFQRQAVIAPRRASGVTLIELMIVVVILSIFAVVAIPEYNKFTQRARRADAMGALLNLSGKQEQFFSVSLTYTTDFADLGWNDGVQESLEGYYSLSIPTGNNSNFVISATPKAGEAQAKDDDCWTFTLDASGEKGAKNKTGTDNPKCWKNR
jgi:type IV pilus assembly protein PilE